MSKKILIYGFGNIGHHVAAEIEEHPHGDYKIYTYAYDIKHPETEKRLNDYYNIVFICVPTDMKESGECDTSIVKEAIAKTKDIADVIVIKSTIPITFCESLGIQKVVYSPEYWGTTVHSEDTPNFTILGGDSYCTHRVADFYSRIKPGNHRFIFTDYRTAELAKYMENCWIATKVTFCNEFATVAKKYKVEYEDLRNCFVADERVSPSHTFVYDDQPYYDSHCLNKDIPAFLYQCSKSVAAPLMAAVDGINQIRKRAYKNHEE